MVFLSGLNAGLREVAAITGDDNSFGRSVTKSYKDVIVGAPEEDDGNGSVYIYKEVEQDDSKTYNLVQALDMFYLDTDGVSCAFKGFGKDVAAQGGGTEHFVLVIGAPETECYYEMNGIPITTKYDAVLVYDYNSTSHKLEPAKIFLEEEGSGAGDDVDIATVWDGQEEMDECTLFDPASIIITTGLPGSNKVKTYSPYCYDWLSESERPICSDKWSETEVESPAENIGFGKSVAIGKIVKGCGGEAGSNPLVVGAPDENGSGNFDGMGKRGAVYIYRDGSLKKKLIQEYNAPENSIYNKQTKFGISVDVDQGTQKIVCGAKRASYRAPNIPENRVRGEAIAYEFDADENNWVKMGTDDSIKVPQNIMRGDADGSLQSVSIDYDYSSHTYKVAMGMPLFHNDVYNADYYLHGAVTIHKFQNKKWNFSGMYEGELDDYAGYDLSLYNQELFVGQFNNKKVRVLEESPDVLPSVIMYLLN